MASPDFRSPYCCKMMLAHFRIAPLFSRGMSSAAYTLVTVERRGAVGLITLNRPKALNALNSALVNEINVAARELDSDKSVGAIVITGSDRVGATPLMGVYIVFFNCCFNRRLLLVLISKRWLRTNSSNATQRTSSRSGLT